MVAALPVLVSLARALADHWMPAGDQGIIATRAYDVFSSHTPLVGQYSLVSEVTGHLTYSPGPMLYWLIALPARFGSPTSIALAIGLANALAVLAIVALARRRGGVALMLLTAAALAVMSRSFMPEALHDNWNPSAGLLPFALLVFLSWSLACGERRLLPAVALLGSFTTQCQVAFLLPSLGVIAVGVIGLGLARRRSRPRPRLWPWAAAALVVLAACWAPPLIDQLEHHPGNLTLLYRAATHHSRTLGLTAGARALVRAIGIPPRWLRLPGDPFDTRLADVTTAPHALASMSTIALLAALACALLVAAWRRRADVAWAALIGVVLCAAFAAIAASTPVSSEKVLGYTLWWGSIAGMWVWLTLIWSALIALRSALVRLAPAREPRPGGQRQLRQGGLPRATSPVAMIATTLGLAIAATAGVTVSLSQARDAHRAEYGPIASIAAQLQRASIPPAHSTILLRSSLGGEAAPLSQAIKFLLRRRQLRILQYGAITRLGSWYELDHHRYGYVVYAYDRLTPSDRRARIVARATIREPMHRLPDGELVGGARTVSVAVAPAVARVGRAHMPAAASARSATKRA